MINHKNTILVVLGIVFLTIFSVGFFLLHSYQKNDLNLSIIDTSNSIESPIIELSQEDTYGTENSIVVPTSSVTKKTYCESFFDEESQKVFMGTVDTDTFRVIGEYRSDWHSIKCLSVDKDSVYAGTEPIPTFDPETFVFLGQSYMKDQNGVYYGIDKKIDGADTHSFMLTENNVPVDNNWVYYADKPIMPNQKGFEILFDYYGKIGDDVYYKANIIEQADADTFRVLGWTDTFDNGGYAIDAEHVYYDGKIIPEADVESFELLKQRGNTRVGYAQDKYNQYAFGAVVPSDFVMCSNSVEDLPGNQKAWENTLNTFVSNQLKQKFEFCQLQDDSIIIGYQQEPDVKHKTYTWLDNNQEVIQSLALNCSEFDINVRDAVFVSSKSIETLVDGTLTLSCSTAYACDAKTFYELTLNDLRSSSSPDFEKREEFYDCGYRG